MIKPEVKFNLINLNSIDLIEDRYKPDIDLTICFNAKNSSSLKSVVIKKVVIALYLKNSY